MMMTKSTKKTSDAMKILERRFLKDKPESKALLKDISLNAQVAQLIYDARKERGLTQKQLADLINTQQSVIARLEDVNYEGHSLSLLHRVGEALGQRLEISMVPVSSPHLNPITAKAMSVIEEIVSLYEPGLLSVQQVQDWFNDVRGIELGRFVITSLQVRIQEFLSGPMVLSTRSSEREDPLTAATTQRLRQLLRELVNAQEEE
jgi:transcriptional regulator with XRE-family HTH domain